MRSKSKIKKTPILLLVLVILFIGGYLFYKEGSLPVNKQVTATQSFIIHPNDSLVNVTQKLQDAKLIRDRLVFFFIVKRLGIEKNIQAGDFRLSPAMSSEEIAKALTHGTVESWVTIVEGKRKEEIASLLSKNFDIPEVEFNAKASEGYLFPDTYLIPNDATVDSVITILTNNFKIKFDSSLQDKVRNLGMTQLQAVTLASIVEREARFKEDRQPVASVLLRRVREGMPLQSDVTIQYALGYQEDLKTWWKPEIFNDDLTVDSPYNTYTHTGLPPGPICNPGLAALTAVANADPNTPYLFYLADKKGHLHYARNGDEHQVNIDKYLK